MNRMQFEAIKHRAAQEATEGTEYDWVDLLDNTEQYEWKAKRMSEEEMHIYWKKIFDDMVVSMAWFDEEAE